MTTNCRGSVALRTGCIKCNKCRLEISKLYGMSPVEKLAYELAQAALNVQTFKGDAWAHKLSAAIAELKELDPETYNKLIK